MFFKVTFGSRIPHSKEAVKERPEKDIRKFHGVLARPYTVNLKVSLYFTF